jgi:hypothetical protein
MQIGKAFSFPFEDKAWLTKFLVAAVVSIVPIVNFAWTGYIVELVKNVIDRKEMALPEWGDFGKKFIDGLIVTVAYFVYSLPALLVVCVMTGVFLVPAIASGGNASQDLQRALGGAAGIVALCLSCLLAIYALVLTILLPGILANFAQKRTFGSCFELGQVYRTVTRHGSAYFMVVLMLIVIGFVIGLVLGAVNGVLSFIPCLGTIVSLIITMVILAYVGAVSGHLVGQYGAEAYGPASALPESDMPIVP